MIRNRANRKLLKWGMVSLLLIFNSQYSLAQSAADKFISNHKQKAIVLMDQSDIPASLILGVSMIESGMGRSKNSKVLNNYFGVKGKNTLHLQKGGYRSAYKQYPNVAASFKDFVRIIKNKKYYAELKGTFDIAKWLHHMNKHGYASAQNKWINDILFVIKKYDLTQFDDDVPVAYEDNTYAIWGTDTSKLYLENIED